MTTIQARFDGTAFLPDTPLEIPVGKYQLQVERTDAPCAETLDVKPGAGLAALMSQYPEDPEWPEDGSAQVDHYLYGMPKR